MKARHLLELVLLSAIWGASFLFMRVLAPQMDALFLAASRQSIAALVLAPITLYYWRQTKRRPLCANGMLSNGKALFHIAIIGLLNGAIPAILFAYATQNLNAGLSSILNATTPIWGALIGALLFASPIQRLTKLGILIGFIGVFLLSMPKLQFGQLDDIQSVIAILMATALYGYSANYSRQNLSGVPPLFIAACSMLFACLFTLPALFTTPISIDTYSTATLVYLLLLGALSTGFAFVLYYRIISHSGATNAMMVTYLIPIFGVFFGWLILGEEINSSIVINTLVILFGVSITTGLFNKKLG